MKRWLAVVGILGGTGAGCDPADFHIDCPRCETPAERAALVDCLTRSKVTPPEDDEHGSTVRATEEACVTAVCPLRPTVCRGYAICGESYCQPDTGAKTP